MNFKTLAEQNEQYIIEHRRYLHAHPELSEQEKETTEYLMTQLKALGLEPKRFENCYGCYADIVGNPNGKTVMLRADIDALPVPEETGLPFTSVNEGVMHACGHDAHASMLLGAAKMLLSVKDQLNGTVRIFFQPAEETTAGSRKTIAEGILNGVDAVYGSHIWGNFEAPYISVDSGNRMASCSKFEITVNGVSAHGSAPNLGVDAIVCASAIIMNLQTYVSRNNDPLNPLVLTVGTIQGGNRWNVVPGKVHFDGTVRTFSPALLKECPEAMERIAKATAEAYGATVEFSNTWLTVPLINDQENLNRIAKNAAVKLYGEESVKHLPTMMGSEDFAFYMEKVPGIFTFLGSKEPDYPYSNHQEFYTVNEALLKRGAAMYAQFAFDYLEEN